MRSCPRAVSQKETPLPQLIASDKPQPLVEHKEVAYMSSTPGSITANKTNANALNLVRPHAWQMKQSQPCLQPKLYCKFLEAEKGCGKAGGAPYSHWDPALRAGDLLTPMSQASRTE